jgi:type VII secretion integral membrane protein EccD
MMVLDLCRVTVRTCGFGTSTAADLTLPTTPELGEILSVIVDLVGVGHETADGGLPERLRLGRVDGSTLDESVSLFENGIRDGDVLLLAAEPIPRPEQHSEDPGRHAVDMSASADRGTAWAYTMGSVACWWSTGIGATTLAWPGPSAPGTRAVVAAILAVAATVAAILINHLDAQPLPTLTLGMTAAVFGAIAGFLAVPGGPGPPNYFLAAAICSTVAAVLMHVTSCGTTLFTAIAAFSVLVAVAAAVAAVWPTPTAAVGAALAAASLAMINTAAKLSIILTGLSPRIPSSVDATADEIPLPASVGALRAARGHQTLTGLLAGFSLSAALGVALVAADQRNHVTWSGIAFTGAVSVALVLRAVQQRGSVRSTTILSAGFVSTTAGFTLAALSAPRQAPWLGVVAMIVGASTLCLTLADAGERLSPFVRRGIEVVDYLALAAVVPLACWVGGLFGFVRGLSLT